MTTATHQDAVGELPKLAHHDTSDFTKELDEKEKVGRDSASDSVEIAEEKVAGYGDHVLDGEDDKPTFHNGEPVITTGKDVSYFAVDIRDDGDEALTFRSMVLGTVFAGLGAALCQVRWF